MTYLCCSIVSRHLSFGERFMSQFSTRSNELGEKCAWNAIGQSHLFPSSWQQYVPIWYTPASIIQFNHPQSTSAVRFPGLPNTYRASTPKIISTPPNHLSELLHLFTLVDPHWHMPSGEMSSPCVNPASPLPSDNILTLSPFPPEVTKLIFRYLVRRCCCSHFTTILRLSPKIYEIHMYQLHQKFTLSRWKRWGRIRGHGRCSW